MKWKERLGTALEYVLVFVAIFWFLRIFEWITSIDLAFLGILPRTFHGLVGVVTAPFIHADFPHLIANTIPFVVLGTLFFVFYPKNSFSIFALLWLTAGLITWIIGRPAMHVGASIIIYALAFFLFFGGIMSKKLVLILVSVLVLVFYGGMLWGIFPSQGPISWEGHLAGALSGFAWAYVFRKSLASD
jgi:membrane associated rhomboid family serine protease